MTDQKTFEYEVTSIKVPEDTVFFRFGTEAALIGIVLPLVRTRHPFVVDARVGQIAMSRAAAVEIGVL